jgi:hypothetical protein
MVVIQDGVISGEMTMPVVKRISKRLSNACYSVMALLVGMIPAMFCEAAGNAPGSALDQAALVSLVSDEVADNCRAVYAARTVQAVDSLVAKAYGAYVYWSREVDRLDGVSGYRLPVNDYAEFKANRRAARIMMNLYKVTQRATELCAEKQRLALAGGGGSGNTVTPGAGLGLTLNPYGRLVGSCTGLGGQSPTANFTLNISSGGTLVGRISGDRLSGSIDGRMDARGLIQASGVAEVRSAYDAVAARCMNVAMNWTGLIEKQADGKLSGAGKWSGSGTLRGGAEQGGRDYTSGALPLQCQCSGTWQVE